MPGEDLLPDADALYGLPLEDFVTERGALAKRLRGEGDREAAKRVAALRKPSVAAWTVNQLVRSRASDVAAFTDAARALRDAQTALLEGRGDAADLREAQVAERAAVAHLVGVARGLFPGGREPGEATLDRVGATLHAAATDEAIAEAVLSGRLLAEREPSGFGGLDVELAALPPKRPRKPARDEEAQARAEREAAGREAAERERRERLAALQAELDEAVAARERAEAALEAARAEEARRRAAVEEAGA
jgi:hypothetical protein